MKATALVTLLMLMLLTGSTPAAEDVPRAVATFECIGLYWKAPGGGQDVTWTPAYRARGDRNWQNALPLWFDPHDTEYRGSIVGLAEGTEYEVRRSTWGDGGQK